MKLAAKSEIVRAGLKHPASLDNDTLRQLLKLCLKSKQEDL